MLQEARDKTFLTNAQGLQDGRTVDLLYIIIEVLFPEMTEYKISNYYRHKANKMIQHGSIPSLLPVDVLDAYWVVGTTH